jgi:hypothetical protein
MIQTERFARSSSESVMRESQSSSTMLPVKCVLHMLLRQRSRVRAQPKCWYQPAAYPDEASLGLRWTLGHPIRAALPPGDERYFRLAMDVAQNNQPLEPHEEQMLMARATGVKPISHLGNGV